MGNQFFYEFSVIMNETPTLAYLSTEDNCTFDRKNRKNMSGAELLQSGIREMIDKCKLELESIGGILLSTTLQINK